MNDTQVACVWMSNVPAASHGRPHLEPVAGRPLIEWAARRFVRDHPSWTVVAPAYSDADISESTDTPLVYVRLPPRTSRVDVVRHVLLHTDANSLTLLTLPFLLLPPEILDAAFVHHLDSRNDFTVVDGLPDGASCEIYGTRLLALLPSVAQTAAVVDPRLASQALGKMTDTDGSPLVRAVPWTVGLQALSKSGLARRACTMTTTLEIEALQQMERASDHPPAHLQETTTIPPYVGWRSACEALLAQRWEYEIRAAGASMSAPSLSGRSEIPTDHGWESRPVDVLFATASLGFTGGERMLAELITENATTGLTQAALLRQPGLLADRVRAAGVPVEYLPDSLPETSVLAFLICRRVLPRLRPRIVHLNGLVGSALTSAALAENVPIVQHVRVVEFADIEEQIRAAARLIAISDFVVHELETAGVEVNRIRRIYNGFEKPGAPATPERRRQMRVRHRIPEGAWAVLMVARYAPNKRHDFLLKALAHARGTIGARLHLVLVGDPATEPDGHRAVTMLAHEMGLSTMTTYIDHTDDIEEIVSLADVLVLCSVREPFGNCVCEAMLTDIPVIVAGTGGYCEVVRDSITGRVVSWQSPALLGDALVELSQDDTRARAMLPAAREFVSTRLSRARYAAEVRAVYEEILSTRPGSIQAAVSLPRARVIDQGRSTRSGCVQSAGECSRTEDPVHENTSVDGLASGRSDVAATSRAGSSRALMRFGVLPIVLVNIGLAWQNYELKSRERLAATALGLDRPTIGQQLRRIAAVDLSGRLTQVDFSAGHPRTLVITFSPGCQFCARNRQRWDVLAPALVDAGWKVVWLSRDPVDVTAEYAKKRPMVGEVLADPTYRSHMQFGLHAVPNTLLISTNGSIERLWGGVIDEDDWEAVLSSSRPLIRSRGRPWRSEWWRPRSPLQTWSFRDLRG